MTLKVVVVTVTESEARGVSTQRPWSSFSMSALSRTSPRLR